MNLVRLPHRDVARRLAGALVGLAAAVLALAASRIPFVDTSGRKT